MGNMLEETRENINNIKGNNICVKLRARVCVCVCVKRLNLAGWGVGKWRRVIVMKRFDPTDCGWGVVYSLVQR